MSLLDWAMPTYRCWQCWGSFKASEIVFECTNSEAPPRKWGMIGVPDPDVVCNVYIAKQRFSKSRRGDLSMYKERWGWDLEAWLNGCSAAGPGEDYPDTQFRFQPQNGARVALVGRAKAVLHLPCPRCERPAMRQCPRCLRPIGDLREDKEVYPIAVVGFSRSGKTCMLAAMRREARLAGWSPLDGQGESGQGRVAEVEASMFGAQRRLPEQTKKETRAILDLQRAAHIDPKRACEVPARRTWLRDYPGEDLAKLLLAKGRPQDIDRDIANMLATARAYVFVVSPDALEASSAQGETKKAAQELASVVHFAVTVGGPRYDARAAICIAKCDDARRPDGEKVEIAPSGDAALSPIGNGNTGHAAHQEALEQYLASIGQLGLVQLVRERFQTCCLFSVTAIGLGNTVSEAADRNSEGSEEKIYTLNSAPEPAGILGMLEWLVQA